MINLISPCTSGSGWTRPRLDQDVSHWRCVCLCISPHAQVHVYQERVWAVSFDCYPFRFTMQLVNSRFSGSWQTVRQLTQTTATQEIITHIMVQLCLASLTHPIHKRAIVNTKCLSHKHILCWLSSIARNITQKHLFDYHIYV